MGCVRFPNEGERFIMDREDILAGVIACIHEILDIDEAATNGHSRIIEDLGADSLDLLELIFHLEQKFRIKLSIRDIENRAKEEMGPIPFQVDGVYTPEAMNRIRLAMPEIPPEELPDGLKIEELPRRFRVATMVNLVAKTLGESK